MMAVCISVFIETGHWHILKLIAAAWVHGCSQTAISMTPSSVKVTIRDQEDEGGWHVNENVEDGYDGGYD